MRFLFIFKFPQMKEGILGYTIRNTTLFCTTFLIIFNCLNLYRLSEAYSQFQKNSDFLLTILRLFYYLNYILILSLSILYVNIFTRKVKQLFFMFNFLVNLVLLLINIGNFSVGFNVYFNINNNMTLSEKFLRHFELFFIFQTISLINSIIYFPVWSYSIILEKRDYKILDKTYEENKEIMELKMLHISK
jgi:hypothetical protein